MTTRLVDPLAPVACGIGGCDRPVESRGWCESHYRRWLRTGDAESPLLKNPVAVACRYDGCENKPVARDLCKNHYYAERRAAERAKRPAVPPGMRRKAGNSATQFVPIDCSIEGCSSPSRVRGWCGAHYQRWRRFGDPEFVPPTVDTTCTIEGCMGPTNARGFCSSHYYRWQTYGDPLYSKNKPRIREQVLDLPDRRCATCGEFFKPTNHVQRYCGRRCKPSRAHRGVNSRATVVRLANQHGWMCAICSRPVDPSIYWPALDAGSVDHVLPVIEGGTDAWANLQLTHLRCNLEKEGKRRGKRKDL